MSQLASQLKIINQDWLRYPYKKFNYIYLYEIKCKNKLYNILKINGKSNGYVSLILIALSGFCQSFTYQFWLRLAKMNGVIGLIAKIKHRHLCKKYGVYIPWRTSIGSGLRIWHCTGIVINPNTKIGDNCDLFQFVSIGEHNGNALIGDNVYIGPHVSIVGKVNIGNKVKIGAGTVVINDIPAYSTSVGNPNRIITKP